MARPHTLFIPVSAVLLFAPAVRAEAPDEPGVLFGQRVSEAPAMTSEEIEARAAGFRALLEAQGQVLVGNQVLPKSALDPTLTDAPQPSAAWDKPAHRATTFLNFFGSPLSNGGNASEGQSPCVQGKIMYPGFKGGEQAALAIIQIFKDAAKPFGMRIVYDAVPPKHLPYSQVMMGGHPAIIGLPKGVLGVSCNLDCGDSWWRDTTFAFTEESNNVGILGTTALQEAAHAWGLDHIDGSSNIMYPYATPGAKVWAEECTIYNDATGGIGCKSTHERFCEKGTQSDIKELTAYFGPDSPDTVPPTVVMMSPTDGQMFKDGDKVHIEVEVSDDYEGFGWRLMIPELGQEMPVYNGQKVWDLSVPPKGVYTIRVEAIDPDRNIGFAEAKIFVDMTPGEETGGDESSGGEAGSSSEGPGGDSSSGETPTSSGAETAATAGESSAGESASDSSDTDPGIDKGDEGCGCRNTGPAPTGRAAWLLVLGAALGLRRRRSVG